MSPAKANQEHNGPVASNDAPQEEKPRLTEVQKKQNHINSEKKRRSAIRDGFDRITTLVPNLEGQGRSEGLVLTKTVSFLQRQIEENQELCETLEANGIVVDNSMKLYKEVYDDQHPRKKEAKGHTSSSEEENLQVSLEVLPH